MLERPSCVEPEALAWSYTTRATSPLVGRCFANWCHDQAFHACARVVTRLLGEPAINNVDDSVDREGCFSDVGRQNDFSLVRLRWNEYVGLLI